MAQIRRQKVRDGGSRPDLGMLACRLTHGPRRASGRLRASSPGYGIDTLMCGQSAPAAERSNKNRKHRKGSIRADTGEIDGDEPGRAVSDSPRDAGDGG